MDKIIAKSNIANKIRNTSLSRKQGLMPLFELISNSIHSISERKKANLMGDEKGRIIITIIRNGAPEILKKLSDIDNYPITSIIVQDNGIGLDNDNLASFTEADSDHKLDIGGKGVGRFVCLKAFKWLEISSTFKNNGTFLKRTIALKNTKQGFEGYLETESNIQKYKTECTLFNFLPEFQQNTIKALAEIADSIITHFQLYFITKQIPNIVIQNQNNDQIDLDKRYSQSFKSKVKYGNFTLRDEKFMVYLSESNSSKSHRLHFCACNRSVIEEWLGKKIIELGKKPISDNDSSSFYYSAFVVSDLLDNSVNNERTSFCFPTNEEDDDVFDDLETEEITLSKIRKLTINVIESLIADYISEAQTLKVETYRAVIEAEMPQYRAVLTRKAEQVKKLQTGLSKQNLDIELYKIESEWKTEIKKLGTELIDRKKDITCLDEYKRFYEGYLTNLNEIGQSELARYITHRKSVIDLLDFLTSKEGEDDKYANEDLVHSLFFPIRSTSDIIPYHKQNLWMIDERLSYHSYLASDKTFNSMRNIEVSDNKEDRPDLLIFSNAFAFATEKDGPYNSITIIEFKKPERDNYADNDEAKNPLDQVERYVEDLIGGKITNRKGRTINITKETPFYIYIISDLTPTLVKILERRDFYKTPDGQGYYAFKSRRYNGYIEIMSFDKIKNDAKKRNKILFDKLGLPELSEE